MLNEDALQPYFFDHSVPQAAQDYIRKAWRSQPEPGLGNSSRWSRATAFVSDKMGRTIQAQSATAEGAFVLKSEHSPECIAYLDQPPPIIVTWTYGNGRKQTRTHIPDFLVLLIDGPAIVQCKTTAQINSLVVERPIDWIRSDGKAVCLAAQTSCAQFGLRHLVFESSDATSFQTENLALLLRARAFPDLVTKPILLSVKRALDINACLTLDRLANATQLTDYTPLIQLIERGILFARLKDDLLTEPQAAWVSGCATTLSLLVPAQGADSLGGKSPMATARKVPGSKSIVRGLENLERVQSTQRSTRSTRLLKSKMRTARERGVAEILAVTPNWSACGNRTQRLPDEVLKYFETHFASYKNKIPPRLGIAHREYRVLAAANHPLFAPMGESAFRRRILSRKQEMAKAEGGIRAEMAAAPSSDVEVRAARPQRPFQQAHIDHHLTDLFVCIVNSGGRQFVERLWLSVLVDSATGMLLEFWLSLRSPSRRACAMLLRRCARRHGRLPENITTDHGAEFRSVYYSALLAYLKVNKHDRPVGNARYGSEAERLFLLYINTYTSSRPGRIKHIRDRRQISQSHSAERAAALSPADVFEDFHLFMDWYNTVKVAPNESAPPAELCAIGLTQYACSGIPRTVDEQFAIASAVESNDYSVDPSRGIHTSIGWFVNGELMVLAGRRKRKIPIREEPEDPYRVYAFLDGRWITCRHSKDIAFLGKSECKRHGEALCLLDGTEQRRQAKDHANMEFTRRMLDADSRRNASAATLAIRPPGKPTQETNTANSNAFARVRNREVRALNVTKWGTQHELA